MSALGVRYISAYTNQYSFIQSPYMNGNDISCSVNCSNTSSLLLSLRHTKSQLPVRYTALSSLLNRERELGKKCHR
uniref:Ovule protein n=1 Tax=Caenorhabditis tropicalis TaxID=1561998 RepID=A0A1I7T525_9PELO